MLRDRLLGHGAQRGPPYPAPRSAPGDPVVAQLVHFARTERLRGPALREFILNQRGIDGGDTAIAVLLALLDTDGRPA